MTLKKNNILGVLYGQAIGDAMGMPSELWPVETIREFFKKEITTFLNGPKENEVALNFTKGQFTDDTQQALIILDSLIETDWVPDKNNLVKHMMKWANSVDAWTNNILGPSSKAALLAIKNNEDPQNITNQALTNGCGMRIAPIGSLYDPDNYKELIKMVYEVTTITHSSDVSIAGASMVAAMVSSGVNGYSWDDMVKFAIKIHDESISFGYPTWAASSKERVLIGIQLAKKYFDNPDGFSKAIYEIIGTGTSVSESIPAAISIAYYNQNVEKCAIMCANLGGDTDTIGAMATAICGSKQGYNNINPEWIKTIDENNPLYDIQYYADKIEQFRNNTNKLVEEG